MKRNNLWFDSCFHSFFFPVARHWLSEGAASRSGTAGTYYYVNGELKTDYYRLL